MCFCRFLYYCNAKLFSATDITLYSINTHLNPSNNRHLLKKTLWGKEEIARNEQFLLFPQCFLLNQKIVSPFVNIYDIISLFAAELQEPKLGMCGKGLIKYSQYTAGH